MKRCWFGAAVLAALLVLGLLSSRWMERQNSRVAEQILQAAGAAASGDWDRAGEWVRTAQGSWQENRSLGAMLSDHAPMDQIDSLLALLPGALSRRDTAGFADLCTRITQALRALTEAQQPSWENLL